MVDQLSRPDCEIWPLNDVERYVIHCDDSRGNPPTLELGSWMCFGADDGNWWMVPQHNLRLSAGVPLKTIRPNVVISSHLGAILVSQQIFTFSFVLLSSFIDGLRAVRQQFERELEKGRRAASTAEERVSNLRKCRERMNAYSDRVVTKHMKVLPVDWKQGAAGRSLNRLETGTVLHLTTPDGRLVESGDETNVAVVGRNWHIIVRVRKDGHIDAEWNNDRNREVRMSPAGGDDICRTKAFGADEHGAVHKIRFVRDPDSKTDAIHMCELITSDAVGSREMFLMRGGAGATGRWLVFVSLDGDDVTLYDTETDKMAALRTLAGPIGAMETFDGLWMWGMEWGGHNPKRWSRLFNVASLQSLEYKDPSIFNKPAEQVQRRVVDKKLDAEAFRRASLNKERHPGHYWVVAGYGPVPASLRAPEHIYKELETQAQLQRYEFFPFWSASDNTEPWRLAETSHPPYLAFWAGAVDVRDGVTAESIKEDPKMNAWRVGVPIESEPSGEFSVTGNTLSVLSPSVSLDVTVKAGRWLWSGHSDRRQSELTLRHESVVDAAKCTTPARLVDSQRLALYLIRLGCLARLIPEEGLRAKIAECIEEVYARGACPILGLLDKNVISEGTSGWHMLNDDIDYKKFEVVPLTGGVVIDCGRRPRVSVGDNVIRIILEH